MKIHREISGYALAGKMRLARKWHKINAIQQALFYELTAICNEKQWPESFTCSNASLKNALGICEATLIKARKALVGAELIFYHSGKDCGTENTYSFVAPFQVSKISTENPLKKRKKIR